MAFCWKIGLNTLHESWLLSFSSLPLAGETTEGEAGREDSFSSVLKESSRSLAEGPGRPAPGAAQWSKFAEF